MDCANLINRNMEVSAADMTDARVNLLSTPLTIQLEVTNKCNLSCASCARNYWDKDINPLGDVSLEVINRLEPFLKQASTIVPFGYGESLISPMFPQVLRRLREINSSSEVLLFTNGLSLNRERIKVLFDYDVNQLCFSIDGANEESFRLTRGGSFARLKHNLGMVRNFKAQSGRTAPKLIASFTASAVNIDQLPQLVHFCAEHGIEHLGVSIARVFGAGQKVLSLLTSDARILNAQKIFEKALEISRSVGVSLGIPSYLPADRLACRQPFNTLFVKWNGEVRLCCASAIVSQSPMYIVAGNLFEQTVQEIWNNSYSQKVRLGLLKQSKQLLNPICRSCPINEISMKNLCKIENLAPDDRFTKFGRYISQAAWDVVSSIALKLYCSKLLR
jgi:radical SAM protein with 4Fe4S-binding SPASM domain